MDNVLKEKLITSLKNIKFENSEGEWAFVHVDNDGISLSIFSISKKIDVMAIHQIDSARKNFGLVLPENFLYKQCVEIEKAVLIKIFFENRTYIILGENFATNVLPSEISLSRSGDDLIVRINNTTDQLTVQSYFYQDGNSAYSVDLLQFADGTVWDMKQTEMAA